PSLPASPQALTGRLPVDLFIFGPGLAGELNIQRKIVKGDTYKNWRLNGEFVQEQSTRFQPLVENDLVLLEFSGEIVPDQIRALFVSSRLADDTSLFAELERALPISRHAMRTLTGEELGGLIQAASGLAAGHPA